MNQRPTTKAAAPKLVRTITLAEAVRQLNLEHAALPPDQRPGTVDTILLARRRWPHLRDPQAPAVKLTSETLAPLQPRTLAAALATLEDEARTLGRPITKRDAISEARRRWPTLRGPNVAPQRPTHYGRSVVEELNGIAEAFINASPQSFDLAVLEVFREYTKTGARIGTLKELTAEAIERWPQFAGAKLEKDVLAAFERALAVSGVR
jgi:hypothetical protein